MVNPSHPYTWHLAASQLPYSKPIAMHLSVVLVCQSLKEAMTCCYPTGNQTPEYKFNFLISQCWLWRWMLPKLLPSIPMLQTSSRIVHSMEIGLTSFSAMDRFFECILERNIERNVKHGGCLRVNLCWRCSASRRTGR